MLFISKTLAFVLMFASVPASANTPDTIVKTQASFTDCLDKLYIQKSESWKTALSYCTTAFNIAFEGQDTKFEVLRGEQRGTRSFFAELKITRGKKEYISFHSTGKSNGMDCGPQIASQSTKVLEELTSETTTCAQMKKYGGITVEETLFGFFPRGETCVRICPQGQSLTTTGGKYECKSCYDLIEPSESWSLSNYYTRSFRGKYTETDDKSNECIDNKGCLQGETSVGKKSDGSYKCSVGCMEVGKHLDKDGMCADDPDYCRKLLKAAQTEINWDQLSRIPKIKVGKCSPQQLMDVAQNYRNLILLRISDFEKICKNSVAEQKKSSNPPANDNLPGGEIAKVDGGPGYLKQYISKACAVQEYGRDVRKIPTGIPQFGSLEAQTAMQILMR